jgi:hypothetical protein
MPEAAAQRHKTQKCQRRQEAGYPLLHTIDLWCHIYTYIEQNGSADTADDEQFLAYVRQQPSPDTSETWRASA